ncbi:SDR family NAD(P)-dependent oxidoreductase [Gordonia insulae]|uniref:3-oxoacyl-[acyl-carrier-protein] reductase MabA n=1 Tax=Gordonia insulae TaxID=2420509 RepID=A0A3G8JLD6_9ACTN|nr:SDR family NAD(P)-dependent oxidoreductase [Gordonia insulae]AZG45823.1 3-oxoacyl-[acyl-carrier-protein] reductase FabG [Gordonia insulae]
MTTTTASTIRTTVVTGGGSGIGRSIAEHLADAGHRVGVLDQNGDSAEEVAAELRSRGAEAVAAAVDVADRTAVDKAIGQVRERFGPVEILVTSAGVESQMPYPDIAQDEWDRIIAVNLTGTFNCTQAVIGDMQAGQWGRIVTISSSSAQSGAPERAHYVASKGGVIGLTKALAFEYAPHGITVNTIPPSIIATPMAEKAVAAGLVPAIEDLAALTPVRRAGLPGDVAAAAAFLCSEQAGFITGQAIGVNGGWYI